MSRKRPPPPLPEVPDAVLRGSERSPVFWLLYDEYDVLEPRWRRRRIDWRLVCTWAEEKGRRLSSGKPPSQATIRKIWERVRALKRREAAAEAAEKAAAPPRTRRLQGKAADLPPPVARPLPPPQPPPYGPATTEDEAAGLANIERMRAIIKQRSGL